VARTGDRTAPDRTVAIRDALTAWLDPSPPGDIIALANPLGTGPVRVMFHPVAAGEDAIIVAASRDSDFPTAAQRLLLGVAANQVAIALRRWHAEQELKVARDQLERRVEERTSDLRAEVAARKRAQEALFREKERAQITFASIADAVVTTDAEGKVECLNPAAEQLTGWRDAEARGLPFSRVCPMLDEGTRKAAENLVEECLGLGRATAFNSPAVLSCRNGQEVPVAASAAPIRERQGRIAGAVVILHDITEHRRLTRQLSYYASHDALTGLVNRREFERRLELMLKHAEELGRQHALFYLDLDQFKVVNDTCGRRRRFLAASGSPPEKPDSRTRHARPPRWGRVWCLIGRMPTGTSAPHCQ
jgi:PAS domain S-box-containing protein